MALNCYCAYSNELSCSESCQKSYIVSYCISSCATYSIYDTIILQLSVIEMLILIVFHIVFPPVFSACLPNSLFASLLQRDQDRCERVRSSEMVSCHSPLCQAHISTASGRVVTTEHCTALPQNQELCKVGKQLYIQTFHQTIQLVVIILCSSIQDSRKSRPSNLSSSECTYIQGPYMQEYDTPVDRRLFQ